MRRLLVEPTSLSAPFWKAATERKLFVPRCNITGRYFFPPERCVPGSTNTDWDYVESSGRGIVYTFTAVTRPPAPDFPSPYILAVVDLEEGWSMLTNIIDCPPESVRVGLPVQVVFLDVEGGTLPVFVPAASP